jgi:hypothetical protein
LVRCEDLQQQRGERLTLRGLDTPAWILSIELSINSSPRSWLDASVTKLEQAESYVVLEQ